MALGKLWVIAFRDLLRNRRRSFFTALAVALGLALLMLLNGYIAGVMEDSLQTTIRLRTGHVQVRAASYEEEKLSLQWQDLIKNADVIAARASAIAEVTAAAPVLWVSAILNTVDDSAGLQIFGIETASPLYAPIQEAMVAGDYLSPDDRSGILIGRRLADELRIAVGQTVNLAVVNSDGQPDEAGFVVRGLFSTGVPTYDDSALFMPLSKAQAFTRTDGHASAVVILVNSQDQTGAVAAALQGPGTVALTWRDLNSLLLQTVETGMSFYVVLDGIVMLIVAMLIANTLLMAVFERIREMGILAALGMKRSQIRLMFLLEAATLGLAGILAGVVLGSAGVLYLATAGIPIGEEVASAADGIAMGTTLYARFVPGTFASLSAWTLAIILLASLYPAWFAARLEPVDALHAL
jgi:ABC-type lipoprotein release transport system permease subunit